VTDLVLVVEGQRLAGFKRLVLSRGLEQLAAAFALTVGGLEPINKGAACTIERDDGLVLLTGYIGSVDDSYDGHNHETSLSGRSKMADVVDCSAVVPGGEFRNQTLEQISERLCAPFGVEVVSERMARKPFPKFAVQEAETCAETIGRAAKAEGAAISSDDHGDLVIRASGVYLSAATGLTQPGNILRGSRHQSWDERFSSYTVKSQSSGTAETYGRSASAAKATVEDAAVTRPRPMVMIAESQVGLAGARKRANWERATRAARSQRITYTVRGWGEGDGIWTPGYLVSVNDGLFGIKDELLIVSATLTKDKNGETTEIEIIRPEALDVLAEPPKKKKDGGFPW